MAIVKTTRPIVLFALIGLLNACASLPPAEIQLDQISVTHLDHSLMRVAYAGTPASDASAVVDMTLLRAAEAALQQGYHYFTVIDLNRPVNAAQGSQPVGLNDSTLYNGTRYALVEPGTSNTIVCFRQKPGGFAYVALFVKASLRARYGLDRIEGAI